MIMELIQKYYDFNELLKSSPRDIQDKYTEPKLREPVILDDFVLDWVLETIQEDYGVTLDKSREELIHFGGASQAWTNGGDSFIYGGFRIKGLLDALTLTSGFWKTDFSLAPYAAVPEELKHFEQLEWFERQAWADDWRFGCFIREKGIFPPRIAFFDKNWYTPMDLTLEEYYEAMFASCAVKGWQYFYIDYHQELPHLEGALEDMEKAVRLLPEIFPGRDFSYHRKKLEELKTLRNRS